MEKMDRVRFIKERSKDVASAILKNVEHEVMVQKVVRMIGWVAPSTGWMRLNTDGALRETQGWLRQVGSCVIAMAAGVVALSLILESVLLHWPSFGEYSIVSILHGGRRLRD